MLQQKDCLDIGLVAGEKKCPYCGEPHLRWYPKREHPENPTAEKCQICEALVWTNGRQGILRKLWADYLGEDKKRAANPGEWWDMVMKEFYERFPPCPTCGGNVFSTFSPVKSYSRVIPCKSCHREFEWSGAEDVTAQHYGDMHWWYIDGGPVK